VVYSNLPMTSFPVALLCCVTIPVLVLLAYIYWAKITRRTLPHWRNALGQISMLVVSADWLFQTSLWVLYSANVGASRISSAADLGMHLEIYYLPVGMASTFFLKGVPRVLVITAWLVTAIFARHFYIA